MTTVISDNNSPFSIKKINIFSSWVFNLPKNTECTICRCSLNTSSLYNQEKGLDSYVVSGICQHSFHHECIKPWVDKNKLCPICFQKWEFSMNVEESNDKNSKKNNEKGNKEITILKKLEDNEKIKYDEKKTEYDEHKIKYENEKKDMKTLYNIKNTLKNITINLSEINDKIDLVDNNSLNNEVLPTNNKLDNVINNINVILKNKEINIIKSTNTIANHIHNNYKLYNDILNEEESEDEMPPLISGGPTGPIKLIFQKKVNESSKKNTNSKGF